MYRNQTSCIIIISFILYVPLLKTTPTVAWVRQARLQLLAAQFEIVRFVHRQFRPTQMLVEST